MPHISGGRGRPFRYHYDSSDSGCNITAASHDGETRFHATYDAEDRVLGLTGPDGGRYAFSYGADGDGATWADLTDPDGAVRRIVLNDGRYSIVRRGFSRRQ
jgi:YD repeat-containing protein